MRIPKEAFYAGAAVICVTAAGWFYTSERGRAADVYKLAASETPEIAIPSESGETAEAPVKRIKVYIAGAVANPGVYELDEGSRVEDALDLAGGPDAEADMLRVNLAARLKDEQQIIVPKVGEIVDKPAAEEQNKDGETLININTADESGLTRLPGIGPVTAGNIIAYRTEHGGFKSIEDIKNVTRIGDKTYERLKDLITID